MEIRRAEREKQGLKIGLVGPSGSGKTYSGLRIARGLVGEEGKILLIDTEKGSGSLYADEPDCAGEYDVIELDSYSPEKLIDAMELAHREGYQAVVIDSLSHFWVGKDGELEMVDQAAMRSKANNRFTAWRDVTPIHNRMIDALVGARMHVIATMRAKTEWVIEKNDEGKMQPRKIGMAPIQRDGMEYEFTVVGDLDVDHNLVITKTRCPRVDGKVYQKPNGEFSSALLTWLAGGAEQSDKSRPEIPAASKVDLFKHLSNEFGQDVVTAQLKAKGFHNLMEVSEAQLNEIGQALRQSETTEEIDF